MRTSLFLTKMGQMKTVVSNEINEKTRFFK
jgi:hypothetical protein